MKYHDYRNIIASKKSPSFSKMFSVYSETKTRCFFFLIFSVYIECFRKASVIVTESSVKGRPNSTLGARVLLFFRSEAAIVSGKAANEILARRDQDLDRGFAAHNRSFATKRKPSGSQGSLSNCS